MAKDIIEINKIETRFTPKPILRAYSNIELEMESNHFKALEAVNEKERREYEIREETLKDCLKKLDAAIILTEGESADDLVLISAKK